MVEVAKEVGADGEAHGCTVKGNDQGDILEDLANEPKKDMYMISVDPEDAPDQAEYVEIESGLPVSVNGKRLSPASLFSELNEIGGRHGIGRADMIENRLEEFMKLQAQGEPSCSQQHVFDT